MLSSLSKTVLRTGRVFPSITSSLPISFSSTPSEEEPSIDFGSLSTAKDAWERSCYYHIDFKIPAESMVRNLWLSPTLSDTL